MNVNDVDAPVPPATWAEVVTNVFDRQRQLMIEYKEIEQLPHPPVSLHTAGGQRVLKDFAWRTVEEYAESWEAYVAKTNELDSRVRREQHEHHQLEEMADALHFLVELLIFAGIDADACLVEVPAFPVGAPGAQALSQHYWRATAELGIAMNFLKNKPWKQSQVPTDEVRLRAQLLKAFAAHALLWAYVGCTDADLYSYYFRKSHVNAFRQRSQY